MKHYKTKPNKSSVVKHLQSTRKLLISMNYFLYIYFIWNICLIYENKRSTNSTSNKKNIFYQEIFLKIMTRVKIR